MLSDTAMEIARLIERDVVDEIGRLSFDDISRAIVVLPEPRGGDFHQTGTTAIWMDEAEENVFSVTAAMDDEHPNDEAGVSARSWPTTRSRWSVTMETRCETFHGARGTERRWSFYFEGDLAFEITGTGSLRGWESTEERDDAENLARQYVAVLAGYSVG